MSNHKNPNNKNKVNFSISQQYDFEHFSRTEDIEFYLELARKLESSNILDIGCGTGRICIPLVQAGWQITCVDKAEVMLEGLRQKIESLSDNLKTKIKVVNLAMQEIDRLETQFDLIIVSFNTFHNLRSQEEQIEFLNKSKKLLTSGGILVIDISIPGHGNLKESKEWQLEKINEDTNYKSERYYRHLDHDKEKKIVSIEFLTKLYDKNGKLIDSWTHNYKSTYHIPTELDQMVQDCGYIISDKYGNYSFDSFSEVDNPDVQVLLLKKNN